MLKEEREDLIEKNLKLVNYVINKKNLGHKRDDFYDAGLIGLIKGVDTFDETKGFKLSSYLYRCIDNAINMALRKKYDFISLDSTFDEDSKLSLEDVIGYDPNYDEKIIENEIIEKIIERMSLLDKKKQFIFYHYWGINGYEKLNQTQLSEITGISQAMISRINSKIIKMLKFYLQDYF